MSLDSLPVTRHTLLFLKLIKRSNELQPSLKDFFISMKTKAWTLLEMLMVMALLLCLAVLTFPTWHGLQKKILTHGSTDLLLSGLEEARTTAIQHHLETWVIFQHRSEGFGDRFCTVQKPEDENNSSVTHWETLPAGVVFNLEPKTLMSVSPPEEIIRALPEYVPGESMVLGSLCYNSQGAIVQPAVGGDQLLLELTNTSKNQMASDQIVFSHLTGRAILLHH